VVRRSCKPKRCAGGEQLEARQLMTGDLAAANVLVLYNTASASGAQIASYYAQVHPGVQLLGISGIDPNSETITADTYLSTIRPQVLAGLTASTEVIVTTKGLPLRIQVTESCPSAPWPLLPTYVDANGVLRTIFNWQPYSSLESELANIQRVSTWQMMGDQTYNFGVPFCLNPYYNASGSFSHTAYGGMYLTSRLDGYTTMDVMAAIDRAQHVSFGPSGPYFLVDNNPSITYAPTMAKLVNEVLTPAGLPTVYDNTSAYLNSAPGPIIGYDSHGTHQASTPGSYLINGFGPTLAAGAVFTSWESFNAYSFTPGGYTGSQGQVAQWLAIGGTAGVGNVAEPGANLYRVTNENLLFSSLIAGKTWAEAAWSSLFQLGYVNTVVGDPLMRWSFQDNSATVVARNLFYNNSAWDSNCVAANAADDGAIATDKSAYQAGSGNATFASVSSYVRGINGIMVDIAGTHGAITASDFAFKIGNNNAPDTWAAAPAPIAVSVRAGAGVGGSDRVEVLWADDAVRATWLRVTLRGNDAAGGWNLNTGLSASDVFYFGSAPGDSGFNDGSGFIVSSADEISARCNPCGIANPSDIANANDFNRDRLVNSMDQILARTLISSIDHALVSLSLAASNAMAASAPPDMSALAAEEPATLQPDASVEGISGIASGLADGAPSSTASLVNVLQPVPDLVLVLAGKVSLDQLTMEARSPFLDQIGSLGAWEPPSGVERDQAAAEVHQQLVADNLLWQDLG
jgi:uncharacterized protein (TIGR03790 family)